MTSRIIQHPLSLALVFTIGCILRLIYLHNGGLWLDEIWSMQTSSPGKSASEIIRACLTDTHPPFFDLLLHYWLQLFPENEFAGRYLALIIGCAGMLLTWRYTLKISKSRSCALLALALVSFSHFHIRYSAEARFYSLLYLLGLIIAAQLILFLQTRRKTHLYAFTAAGVLIAYTHYYGAILLFSCGVAVLLLRITKRVDLRSLVYFLGASLFILLCFSPWLPVMFGASEAANWIQPPGGGTFFEYFYLYTSKNPVESLFLLSGVLLAPFFAKKEVMATTLLLSVVLLVFLIPFLISVLVVPMLHERYTMVSFPAIIMLTAMTWGSPAKNWQKVLPVVSLLSSLVMLTFVKPLSAEKREPWREVSAAFQKVTGKKQLLVAESAFWISYYLERDGLAPAILPLAADTFSQGWVLRTPYDSDLAFYKDLTVLEKQTFGNGFELQYCSMP